MTTTRSVTILISALWLAGCANRNQQATNQAASAPASAPAQLLQPFTIVVTNANPAVYIDGEVMRPNRFVWSPEMTLINAIALAGGFTEFAHKSRLEVRHIDGTSEFYNYARILNGLTNNPALKVNDQVYVPRRLF